MKHPILLLLPITALVAAEPVAPKPQSPNTPHRIAHSQTKEAPATEESHASAKHAVQQQIVVKLMPKRIRFSRAAPRLPSPSFKPSLLVDGESRLPFSISERFSLNQTVVEGYVRLSDQEIFILDPKSGKYHAANNDPRFAPQTPPSKAPKTKT